MSLNRILQLKENVEAFQQDIPYLMIKIVKQNEAYITDMNTEDQLYEQGVNNLGVSIMDYRPYAEFTIAMKHMTNQPSDRVTLRDTGDFHSSFFLQVGTESFEIMAGDSKTDDLIKKYGRQILGLTDENIANLIQGYIYPDLCMERDYYLYGKY